MTTGIPTLVGPYVVPQHFIGDHQGSNGTGFAMGRFSNGHVVKRIGVHYNPSTHLRGISITYSDDHRESTGTAAGNYAEIILRPGEKIVAASLWGNGVGTRTGRIRFETDQNRSFNAGRDTSGQDEFPINVGSGILAGFRGRSGTDIFILAFVFILPVSRTVISNVRYTVPSRGISSETLQEVTYRNDHASGDVNWDFSNSVTRINTVAFSSSVTAEFSASLTISAGVPGIVDVSSGYTWGVGTTSTWTRTNETQVVLVWGLSGTLAPGERILCRATCQYGKADVDYTADVQHTFPDGQLWSYTDRGVLDSAQYAFANATALPAPNVQRIHELDENTDDDVVIGKPSVRPRL